MEEKTVRKSTILKVVVMLLSIGLAVTVAALCYVYFSKEECNTECACNKVVENTTNTGDKDTTSEVNPSMTKLTDAEANEVRSKATDKVSEDLGDFFINGYILDNVFYFDIDDSGTTSLYKLNNLDNPVRVRIFNKIGALGMSPTYYVITEDGKVYAVPDYIGVDTKIERVFEEYKVKDINKINVECDDTCHGEVILVLQDDTVKEIKY